MPASILGGFRHFQAENYKESYSEASPDVLYLFIGKNSVWSTSVLGRWYGGEGINYTSAPAVSFSGGGGSSASATAVINAYGQITGFTSLVGGSGYTSAPTVTITGGGGVGGAATATVAAGAVTALTLVPVDEDNPPTPVDSTLSFFQTYDDIIALKKILPASVSHVIKRLDWTTGTVYDQYEDFVNDLEDRNYFVMNTDTYYVYKCIYNNGGATSTVAPTGSSTSVITTADGYKWKFMYEVRTTDVTKFMTTDWIPVPVVTTDDGSLQYDVQAAAVDGAIDHIQVISGGTGYTTGMAVTISGGGGSSATATVVASGGVVTGITITGRGSGYRNGVTADLSGVGGGNATARVIVGPTGGHGSNAKNEMGGFYVMMNARLVGADGSGDFPVGDDFRQVGLLLNPTVSSVQASATTYAIGEIDDNSGRIIYLENRKKINRLADSTEDVKLVVAL